MEFNATFFVSAISFLLFTLIMNKIFYKPVSDIMNKRQNFIDENLQCAKYSSDKADAIINDREDQLQKSIQASKKTVADASIKASIKAQAMTQEAKQKSRIEINERKNEIYNDALKLEENIKPQIKELAQAIVLKVTGVNLTEIK